MKRTETCELTTLCLIRRGEEILLQNRIKKDWQGYTLPGGHVEPGESVVQSVIREVREETGLTVENPRLCGLKQFPTQGGRYLVFLFSADNFSGELHPSREGNVEWVRRDSLDKYPCVEDLEELLQVMERQDLTEFQYIVEDGQWKVSQH